MTLPAIIALDDEVILGSGPAALTWAATRVACGHAPPIVLEQRSQMGGMFVPLANFHMNSARGASVESVRSPGPTRVPSRGPSDDLNWIPNAPYQVNAASGMVEYPYSQDFWKTVAKGLKAVARCYTDAHVKFNADRRVLTADGELLLGRAKRVIFAGGLTEPQSLPKGPAIISGYKFLQSPVRNLGNMKIAVVGAGATGSQIVEWMFGGGIGTPTSPPEYVDWYGGERMPVNKLRWMSEEHARFAGVGRHLPTDGDAGNAILHPCARRAEVASMGGAVMVNGQNYDLAILATGFVPAPCPVSMSSTIRAGGMRVAKFYDDGSGEAKVFTIGTAADLKQPYLAYKTRFPAAMNALYNTLPGIAALAASLP